MERMGHYNNPWDWITTEIEMETSSLEKKVATTEKRLDLTDLLRFCTHLYNFGYQFTHDLLMTWNRDWLKMKLSPMLTTENTTLVQ